MMALWILYTTPQGCESFPPESRLKLTTLCLLKSDRFVRSGHCANIDVAVAHLSLASLTIDYLNMPGFRKDSSVDTIQSLVQDGFYAFMDYAVACWLRHVEQVVDSKSKSEGDGPTIDDLAESLGTFLDVHSVPEALVKKNITVSKGNERRLKAFEHQPFFPQLQQVVTLLRKELTFYGQIKQSEVALDLTETVTRVRTVLEAAHVTSPNNQHSDGMTDMYGLKVFKCPRLSCRYFYDGFPTAQDRDQHRYRHERPFRCTVIGCVFYSMGFDTIENAQKHVKETHNLSEDDAAAFPDMKEVIEGWQPEPVPPVKRPSSPVDGAQTETTVNISKPKRLKITEWSCPHCLKVFKKKFNHDSHIITHSSRRDFVCEKCGKAFAREDGRKKHEKIHKPRQFVCGETLPDGSSWGCGSKFARLDTLQDHHRSATGKACLASQQLVVQFVGSK